MWTIVIGFIVLLVGGAISLDHGDAEIERIDREVRAEERYGEARRLLRVMKGVKLEEYIGKGDLSKGSWNVMRKVSDKMRKRGKEDEAEVLEGEMDNNIIGDYIDKPFYWALREVVERMIERGEGNEVEQWLEEMKNNKKAKKYLVEEIEEEIKIIRNNKIKTERR